MNKLFFYTFSALLAGGTALSVVSCADNDLDNSRTNGNDALVRFNVNDVQEGAISRGVMTRGAITPGLGSNDLAGGKLVAHSNRNIDVCLIETTVKGVNPVKADAHTRAEIITTSILATSLPQVYVVQQLQAFSPRQSGSMLSRPRAMANFIRLFTGRLHNLRLASLLSILTQRAMQK